MSPVSSSKIILVIETVSTIGKGTESDPSRYLNQYWSLDGDLLAEHDMMDDIKEKE